MGNKTSVVTGQAPENFVCRLFGVHQRTDLVGLGAHLLVAHDETQITHSSSSCTTYTTWGWQSKQLVLGTATPASDASGAPLMSC